MSRLRKKNSPNAVGAKRTMSRRWSKKKSGAARRLQGGGAQAIFAVVERLLHFTPSISHLRSSLPHLLLFRRRRVWASYFIFPSLFAGEGDTHIVFPPTNQPLSCFFVWYGSTISALLSRVSLSLFCGKRRAGGRRASSVVFFLFRLLTWKSLIPPSPREKEATGGGTLLSPSLFLAENSRQAKKARGRGYYFSSLSLFLRQFFGTRIRARDGKKEKEENLFFLPLIHHSFFLEESVVSASFSPFFLSRVWEKGG